MFLFVLPHLAVFLLAMLWLSKRQRRGASLGRLVLAGLLLGVAFGLALQWLYGFDHPLVNDTLNWVNVVGGGYVRLLQMIVMPLVLVSILGATVKLHDLSALGKIGFSVLAVLMVTVAISAAIGIAMAQLFGLSAEGLAQGARELARGDALVGRADQLGELNLAQMIVGFIPANPFAELTGARPTSIISVVIFSMLLGLAAMLLRREEPEVGAKVVAGIELASRWVLRLTRMIIRLTPYGVMALMTQVVATSNLHDILQLINFVVASYLGLGLILLLHALLLALGGISPLRFFRKVWPVLTFAFTSRSSAASIPLNIDTQVSRLGVDPAIANFSASFGATIGQNGCAGLYPAMLAVMIAPTVGVDPMTPGFILGLIAVVAISSFGIAGVGGGATFAAIIVLSTLDLPIALAGLLISIEPLIDMGRTAINVNGSMTTGALSSRVLGQTDWQRFDADDDVHPEPGRSA
ncbi:L-cystine transporter [Halotalea alkalilenta]|uniref:L-cystine transporter n=1 Tax=Halotalea alkalilenta TaxID=376489 RepID=UPI0004846936|nr:L-cystine transporter [Halotalea alkalilenta]